MGTTLIITKALDRANLTVLSLEGRIDGSTYETLLESATDAYRAGTRDLILDISGVRYISSAGLVALHQITRMMCNDLVGDLEGWAALHAAADETEQCLQHMKLVNPQPGVNKMLETAGLQDQFEIHPDLASALASVENMSA